MSGKCREFEKKIIQRSIYNKTQDSGYIYSNVRTIIHISEVKIETVTIAKNYVVQDIDAYYQNQADRAFRIFDIMYNHEAGTNIVEIYRA